MSDEFFKLNSKISERLMTPDAVQQIEILDFENKMLQAEVIKLTHAIEALQHELNQIKFHGIQKFPDTIISLPSKVKT